MRIVFVLTQRKQSSGGAEFFFWISSTAFADFARGIDSYPFRVFGVFSGFAIASLYKPRNTQNTHKKSTVRENLRCFFHYGKGSLAFCFESSINLIGCFHVGVDVLNVFKTFKHIDELIDSLGRCHV